MQNKKQAVFLDATVLESCNLNCDYCRDEVIFDKTELADLTGRIEKALSIAAFVDFDVFKISGYGEITLLENLSPVIDLVRDKRLLIITNATGLTPSLVDEVIEHPDPSICISLDGHTIEMNVHRHLSQSQLDRIFTVFSYIQTQGVPLEINTVLTQQNINSFRRYLDFLLEQGHSCAVFPFPVRRFLFMKEGDYFPTAAQVESFERQVMGNYDFYQSILPPHPYLERLITFMKEKRRSSVCTVPHFVVGINGSMDVLGCPCGPTETLGNLGRDSDEYLLANLLNNRKGRWGGCANCFNHYEAISMYMTGEIDGEEILRIPSISSESILSHLEEIKTAHKNG